MTLRYATREACDDGPSDLALDRLNLGLLDGARAAEVEGHLAGCEACAARFARITEGFDAFPALDERRALAAARPTGDRRPPWLAIVALLGAAAAVALFTLRPTPAPDDDPGVRSKGSAALRIFRRPAGTEGPGTEVISGSRFAAGDALRFAVDLPRAGAIAIYGRERGGAPYLAWPRDGRDPVRAAGDLQVLPGGSARLDDAPGPETLYLVHCPGLDRLPECAAEGPDGLRCPETCTVSGFVIQKGAP